MPAIVPPTTTKTQLRVVSVRPRARLWFQLVLLLLLLGGASLLLGASGNRIWELVAEVLGALACLCSLIAYYFHRRDPPQQVSMETQVADFPGTWVDPSLPPPNKSLERTRER